MVSPSGQSANRSVWRYRQARRRRERCGRRRRPSRAARRRTPRARRGRGRAPAGGRATGGRGPRASRGRRRRRAGRARVGGERFELVAEDDIGLGDDAVDDDRVAVHLLDQRAHRRDPDAARRSAATFCAAAAASVKAPNGPSAKTRVPGRCRRTRSVKSPRSFTVIRSQRPSGRRGERERVRLPPAVAGPGTARGRTGRPGRAAGRGRGRSCAARRRPAPSVDDLGDPQPVAERVARRARAPGSRRATRASRGRGRASSRPRLVDTSSLPVGSGGTSRARSPRSVSGRRTRPCSADGAARRRSS